MAIKHIIYINIAGNSRNIISILTCLDSVIVNKVNPL